MRAAILPALAGLALLGGCASRVALLSPEPGADVGSVVVLDPKTEAERGVLTSADSRAGLRGSRVRARPLKAGRYAALLGGLPPPASQYVLYFVEGGAQLAPGSEADFARLLEEAARRPGAEVQITGHTDTVGGAEDNDLLSRKRAAEVRDALVARGLDPSMTRAVGRGERDLLVKTEDGVAEARNRRVEVTVR